MARPRILTPEESAERQRARAREYSKKQWRMFKQDLAQYGTFQPSGSEEPTGLYGEQFPIFTFALQDTLRFVRSL